MYKEKVKMIIDVTAKDPTTGYVNIHHTWPFPLSSGTINAHNVVFNDGNH